jgi:hypothetical protein
MRFTLRNNDHVASIPGIVRSLTTLTFRAF